MTQKYLSATEAAKKLGLSRSRIKLLADRGRIVGSRKIGNQWAFPAPVRVLPPAEK